MPVLERVRGKQGEIRVVLSGSAPGTDKRRGKGMCAFPMHTPTHSYIRLYICIFVGTHYYHCAGYKIVVTVLGR